MSIDFNNITSQDFNNAINSSEPIEPRKNGYALSIASVVCGVISLATFCLIGFLSAAISLAALICGILAIKYNNKLTMPMSETKRMATTGIVIGTIGLILSLIMAAGLAFMLKKSILPPTYDTLTEPDSTLYIDYLEEKIAPDSLKATDLPLDDMGQAPK